MGLRLKAGQFYGQTAQALEANGFTFTEKSYSSLSTLPYHAHELAHFCLVLSGHYKERIGSTYFERNPAVLVFYPSDVSHSEEHKTLGRHFLVEIDFNGIERVTDYGVRLDQPLALGSENSWLAMRMYNEFIERDSYSALALESISIELLIAASRQIKPKLERSAPRWLRLATDYLRENYATPPALGELAAAVGVHPTHLARVFRAFEGCTVGDYVRRVRIDEACQKILSGGDSLVEIALDAGFADQTHFTRSFRRVTGMTPTEYRNNFRPR